MNTSRLLAAGLALVASASLAACAQTAPAAQSSSESGSASAVTIGLTYIPNVQFSPVYVAEDSGLYSAAGLDATIRHHGSDEGLFTALLAGEENAVVASGDEALVAASQGMDLVSIGAYYTRHPGVVIVPASSPIQSLADLKDKTLGIPGEYGSSYFAALAAIEQGGLRRNDVNLASIGYTQQAALAQGSVDAVLGFSNNDLVQMTSAGMDVRAIPLAEDTPLVAASIITTREWASSHPDLVKAIVSATSKGAASVVEDPGAALDATAKRDENLSEPKSRENARAVLEATIPLLKNDSGEVSATQDEATWERMGAFLGSIDGVLGGAVDAAKVVTNDYVGD